MRENRVGSIYGFVHMLSLVLLCLLALAFFSPFFIDGKAFLAADNLFLHYPWKHYAPPHFSPHNPLITDPVNSSYAGIYNKRLKDGMPAQWSPSVLTGVPGSSGEPGPYAPLKMLLHRLFPTHVALTLLLFIHMLLMGLFMYGYLLEIGAGWRGALFGAIAYMFNGCVMVWLEFEMWVTVGAYLPLLLFFMERYSGEKRLLNAFAGGAVFGLMFLNSAFQLTLYVSVFMVFYLGFIIARAYGRNEGGRGLASIVMCFAVTCITGLLIGAVEILPFIELASNSSRINRTFEFNQFFSSLARVPFRYFITLFFPDFFGSPILKLNIIPRLMSQQYMNYNELALYAGTATVFAFTGCMLARKTAFSRFYLFMTALMVALITGTYAYYPFFKVVPGMDKMNPTRLIFLFMFVASAAAGLGIKGLEDMTPARKKIFAGASLLILAVVSLISYFGNSPELVQWFNKENFDNLPPNLMNDLLATLRDLRSISSPVIYRPLLLTVVACCLFSLFVLVSKKRIVNVVFFLILALLSYDLVSFGRNYNTAVVPEYIYPKTPAIEFLLNQPGPFRVFQDEDSGLYVNALIPFGLEEVGGYRSVYPDRINKLMSYIQFGDRIFDGAIFDRWVTFGGRRTDFSSRIFDLMNVRYVLTAPYVEIFSKKYRLVFREDLAVYENMEVMPRAYVVHNYAAMHDLQQVLHFMWSDDFDMRNQVVLEEEPSPEFTAGTHSPSYRPQASIEKYTPDKINLRTDLSANGWLVLSDTYYPGWRATVDGKETAIHRANCNFRAVALPAGKHYVSFLYRSPSVHTGMILTTAGALLAVIGIYISRRQNRRGKDKQTGPGC